MKYFSHRHKLQRFEAGLNGAACFKIFQVKVNPILTSFKSQMCLLSSVLSLLFGSLKEDFMVRVSGQANDSNNGLQSKIYKHENGK